MKPLRSLLAHIVLPTTGALRARALLRLTFLALLAGTHIGVVAATYYIDPTNGNNDHDGLSSQTAWKTFRNIFTYRGDRRPAYYHRLAAGDTVYVMDGTISEIHRPGDDNGAADVSGDPALMRIDGDDLGPLGTAPLRLLAYPGHHPVLDANYQGTGIYIEHADSVEIAGLTIRRAYGAGILIDNSTDTTIHGCEISDGGGKYNDNMSGIYAGASTDVEIFDCVLHDNYDRRTTDDEVFRNPNSTNMVFMHCLGAIEVHDCLIYQTPSADKTTRSGGGIKYKASTEDPTSTFEVHRNVFRNCKFFSFESASANTHFHHNIIIGGNTAISSQDCANTTHQVNQIFEYNTIYLPLNTSTPSLVAPAFGYHPTTDDRNALFPADPQNVVFRHNIVCDNGTYSTENTPVTVDPYITDALYAAAITELFIDHNAYFSSSGTAFRASLAADNSNRYPGPLYGGYYDWNQWRALTWTAPGTSASIALGFDAHSLLADPQFAAVDLALTRYDATSNAFRPTNAAVVDKGAYAGLGGTTDTTAPTVPTGLSGAATSATAIRLTWTASSDPSTGSVPASGVAGYNIFRDGTLVGTALSTTYTDTGLTSEILYSYQVVAVDAAGNVSPASTTVPVLLRDPSASLLWRDDFDDGQPLTSKYEDVFTNGFSVSTLDSRTGGSCVAQTYATGQVEAGGVIKYRSAGYPDRVFMRWYHKFEAGFQGFPPKMARIRYRNHADWTSPMEIHCWLDTSATYGGTVNLDVKAQHSTQANSVGWLAVARSDFSFANPANIDRWVCFEMEVQLNTPGAADGAYRLWIDDTLAVERTGVDLRGSQTYSINECMLDCYWNGGSPRPQRRFYDSFVIATAKIGPEPDLANFTSWRAANFTGTDLTNDAISGPEADPDGAGLTNLARYAFALPARGPVANPITVGTATSAGASYLTLTFPRRNTADGLTYTLESSTDLVTWTTVPDRTYTAGIGPITAQDAVALGSAPRRFLRIRITAP